MSHFLGIALKPHQIEISQASSAEDAKFIGAVPLSAEKSFLENMDNLSDHLRSKELNLGKNYEGICLSIDSGQEIYRKLHFPFSAEQVSKTIEFEFYDQIRDVDRNASENQIFDYQTLKTSEKQTEALAVSSSSNVLKKIIAQLEKVDLDPEKVTPELSAIITYIKAKMPFIASGDAVVVHTSPHQILLLILKQGELIDVRPLKIQLGDITQRKVYKEKLSSTSQNKVVDSEYEEEEEFYALNDYSLENLEKEEQSKELEKEVETPSEKKQQSLKRLLLQLHRTLLLMPNPPKEVVVLGDYSADAELIHAINSSGIMAYEPTESLDLVNVASLGAVNTFFAGEQDLINFRKKGLEYKGFFEKIAGPLNIAMVFLLCITVTVIFFLSFELERIKKNHQVYFKSCVDVFEKVRPGVKINPGDGAPLYFDLLTYSKKLDFEANVDEYEKKYPIISTLQVWYEYEKLKNDAQKSKIAMGGEKVINIDQTQEGVTMVVSKARAAKFTDMTNFAKLFNNNGFFQFGKETQAKNDEKENAVIFDFIAKKRY